MKRLIFIFIVIFAVTVPVFAQENHNSPGGVDVDFSVGNMGFGVNFPLRNEYDVELSLSVIQLGVEDSRSGLGFRFSPFTFFGWSKESINEEEIELEGEICILNFTLYWNVVRLNVLGSDFYLGPFATINYMFVDEEFYWDKFVFTAGIQMGFRANFGQFKYNIFTLEVGYRNINGSHRYYVGGKIDLITMALASALSGPSWYY